jgi:membrane-bound serine protease (ClpP class)
MTSPTASLPLELNLPPRTKGKALTDLRPSGSAEFHGKTFDVLAEGQFIPQGGGIRIHKVEGSTIFVEAIQSAKKKK